ncbi:MAG TPA: carbohydrate-binding protein [Vicinamibacterales bacterium]|nr:carbohydrate-binding protein [Vicinamibacterales bacterium]
MTLLGGDVVDAAPRNRADEVARGHRAAAREVLVRMKPAAVGAPLLADPLADLELDEPIGPGAWRLVRSRSRSADLLSAIMRSRPDVDVAEPNFAVQLTGMPDDLSQPLWALQNTGQLLSNGEAGTPGVDLDAAHAWDVTQGSKRIVIATVDTGVMQTHRDLAANLWSAPRAFTVNIGGALVNCAAGSHGFNAITRSCDPADDNGHGTHVAGSMGAVGNNTSGVVGINWATSIMALKFMDAAGNGYLSDAINAIEFALQARQAFASTGDAEVRVLNNSWSGGGFSQALSDEIAKAGAAGMLFVASAGNTGVDHELTPVFPSDYAGANVLSVAATDYRDRIGAFSDFGARHVHVGAPGVLIYSTTFSTTDPAGSYGTLSGTSMAAAYTSGVAALTLSHCPYTVGALRDALLRTAVADGALLGRTQTGSRLNAAAAVRSCDGAVSNGDIVIHAADIAGPDMHGAWAARPDPGAADGVALAQADAGWSSTSAPVAQPADYVDVRFTAQAGVPYRVWLRLKAAANSKWNDSVWLQFSDARVGGAPAYALNTDSGLAVNLENCANCGMAGWGWQDGAYWLTRSTITFGTSGGQTLRLQTREDGVSIDQIVVSPSTWLSTAPGQVSGDSTIVPRVPSSQPGTVSTTPFNGAPAALPGTVQVEDFDNGGEGLAYHDIDASNSGSAYRQTGVDIENASGGGYNVGWVAAGEWLSYTVNVSTAGSYTAQFRVASYGGGGSFHLEIDGANVTGPIAVPDTRWWQTWQTVSRPVQLPAGRHVARLAMDATGANAVGNFDWFAVVAATPALALPGRISAADFDSGGEGVAYHDDSTGNSGGAYRSTDVDIEPSVEGGYNVGWIGAGEWLRYTVNVASAGSYVLRLRVASPGGGGALHVIAGGVNLTGTRTVPQTGGWQAWTTLTVPVTLAAGVQSLRVEFESAGFNLRYLDVSVP